MNTRNKEMKNVFVAGSGLMGSGIAQTAAKAGYEVTLYDIAPEALDRARDNIVSGLNKRIQKGKMTEEERDGLMSRLTFSGDIKRASEADLVIEAVYENENVKKALISHIADFVQDNAIITSNTSSISITELSRQCKHPEKFMGTHFFAPVPAMKLLELVKTPVTSRETIEAVKAFGESIGKLCIVSKDRPAFIVNRMLDPMINEAISLVESGTGSIEDIDLGMRYGLNHPMGPLELIDMSGLDIELAVMEVLYRETGDPKYRPCQLLRDMVRLNWLGRKTGKGFYIYHADGTRTPNPALENY